MKRFLLFVSMLCVATAWAGPFDDATAAYERADYASALRLLRPLAAQGDASAQSNLGLIYTNGQGVAQDYVRAHMWFNVAAVYGHPDGAKNSGIVVKLMSAQQIAQARQLAFDCQQRKFKGCD